MFIGFGDLIKIAVLIIGILWCKEIFGRFRNDLAELKDPLLGCDTGFYPFHS
jgi:hypothetical protein